MLHRPQNRAAKLARRQRFFLQLVLVWIVLAALALLDVFLDPAAVLWMSVTS